MSPTLRLTAVLAHPDDESLGVGGTLVRYASEGVATTLVTATRGDAGRFGVHRDGPGHPGREELGRIREGELREAAAVLGIGEVEVLGYPDGALDQVDPRQALARIAAHLRRVRPQVVVTFPHDGSYGHPDHIAISQFTTAACIAAADPSHAPGPAAPHAVSKLYYMGSAAEAWAAYQEAFKRLTSTVDGVERQASPWPEWALTTEIDTREHWPTVWRAVCCHRSQMEGYQRLHDLTPEHHEGLWGRQTFYRVFSTVNGGRRRETDLFEGLRD
jgi:LmbE family N-acetylglucosaminyl deacetylase